MNMIQEQDCLCLQVAVADVKKVYHLFVDQGRSERFLKEYEDEFLFDEGDEGEYLFDSSSFILWSLSPLYL